MSTGLALASDDRDSLLDRVRSRLASTALSPTAELIADAIRSEAQGMLGDTDLLAALQFLQTELVGAGKLEPLLAQEGIADILVVGPRHVWIDCGTGLRKTSVSFDDEAAVRRLATRLALGAGKRLDDAQPWVDGQLAGIGRRGYSVRLHAIIPPLAPDGTCLSLRVLRSATQDFDELVRCGAIPEELASVFHDVLDARLAFLISGGTGAGKTTLLSGMIGAVDSRERVLCVEDASELAPDHPHLVRLIARTANVEGVGEVPMRTLVRQALRMRPDRIIVGEVRGAEVIDLLSALNTGHEGCAGTVHANSPSEVPARMEALAALGGMDRMALHSQLAAALQLVIGVNRGSDGFRGVAEVGVVRRGADGLVSVEPIWLRNNGFLPARTLLDDLLRRRRW